MSGVIEPVKIIGIGSPFGADRIGWEGCERLRQSGIAAQFPQHEIVFEMLDRPGPSLISAISGMGLVVLIDALQSDNTEQSVSRITLHELLQQEAVLSSHALGVAESLSLAEALGQLPRELVLFGIHMNHMNVNNGDWFALLAEQITATLQAYLARN